MKSGRSETAIATLKGVLKSRRLKMTDVARQINIPYRTIQNYFSLKSEMPLWVYIDICQMACVDFSYPIYEKFHLDYHELQQALIDVLGDVLPHVKDDEDGIQILRSDGRELTPAEIRRFAGNLAHLIRAHYDRSLESQLRTPLDEE